MTTWNRFAATACAGFLFAGIVMAGGPHGPGPGGGCKGDCGCGKGAGRGAGAASMGEIRDTFHALLADHTKIVRMVEEIDGGVATATTSADPAVAEKIRVHARQMKDRLATGQGLRHWDPLFVKLFEHHEEIAMSVEEIPNGVRVVETSKKPEVTKLIRAHALAVSEFVECGFDRVHEPTPLP